MHGVEVPICLHVHEGEHRVKGVRRCINPDCTGYDEQWAKDMKLVKEAEESGQMNYVPIKEFLELGFLQEINRRILHPAGLAMALQTTTTDETGVETTVRIWDARDDPEGWVYNEPPSREKADRVIDMTEAKVEARIRAFGSYIQQPGD